MPGGSWNPPKGAEDYGNWSLCVSFCTHWSGLQNQELTDYFLSSWCHFVPQTAFNGLKEGRRRPNIGWKIKIVRVSDLFFIWINTDKVFCCRSFLLEQLHLIFLLVAMETVLQINYWTISSRSTSHLQMIKPVVK